MLPFAGYLRRQLGMIAPKMAAVCSGSFLAGIVAFDLRCFVVPHTLTTSCGFGDCMSCSGSAAVFLALARLAVLVRWKGRYKSRGASRLFWIWSASTTSRHWRAFSAAEALLILTRLEQLGWQPSTLRLRHSIFWHLGFFEWTGAVAVFAFLCAAVFLLPAQQAFKS